MYCWCMQAKLNWGDWHCCPCLHQWCPLPVVTWHHPLHKPTTNCRPSDNRSDSVRKVLRRERRGLHGENLLLFYFVARFENAFRTQYAGYPYSQQGQRNTLRAGNYGFWPETPTFDEDSFLLLTILWNLYRPAAVSWREYDEKILFMAIAKYWCNDNEWQTFNSKIRH